MAWLNFDHSQSNSKKYPIGWKGQNVPNEIFSRKTTNKIFMYLLAVFILQNLKKIFTANPELWGSAIFVPKMAHLSWTKFFWYKPLSLLSSTYWPLALFKIQKKFLQRIQSYENASFLGPKWCICHKFFWEKIIIIFIYLLALLTAEFLKNSSSG